MWSTRSFIVLGDAQLICKKYLNRFGEESSHFSPGKREFENLLELPVVHVASLALVRLARTLSGGLDRRISRDFKRACLENIFIPQLLKMHTHLQCDPPQIPWYISGFIA
jgi:hypothetical protein